jgi:hypothetical protein
MNMQKRSDERSFVLHREIAKKLRSNPELWDIPKMNLARWKKLKNGLPPALTEWEDIFRKEKREHILTLLESDSEDSRRLRSSSPFTGILSENERMKIFEKFRFGRQSA